MSSDRNAYLSLLAQAQRQADEAAAQNRPEGYRDAFHSLVDALRLLDPGDWREAVARATEEYQGDEGV